MPLVKAGTAPTRASLLSSDMYARVEQSSAQGQRVLLKKRKQLDDSDEENDDGYNRTQTGDRGNETNFEEDEDAEDEDEEDEEEEDVEETVSIEAARAKDIYWRAFFRRAERLVSTVLQSKQDDDEGTQEHFPDGYLEESRKANSELLRTIVYKILTKLGGLSSVKAGGMFFSTFWKEKYVSDVHLAILEVERAFLVRHFDCSKSEAKDLAQKHLNRCAKEEKELFKQSSAAKKSSPDLGDVLYDFLWGVLMTRVECRQCVTAFIGKERSAFIKNVSKESPKLERLLRNSTEKEVRILSFAGVPRALMPKTGQQWVPHEQEELLPIRKTLSSHGVPAYEPQEQHAAGGISLECVFNWTRGPDGASIDDKTIAIIMAWAVHTFAPPKTKNIASSVLSSDNITFSQFFDTVKVPQLAWLWTVLLRRGHGTTRGSNKHHAAAGHGNILFDRCKAYVSSWKDELEKDTRTFSIRDAIATLICGGNIPEPPKEDTEDTQSKKRRRREEIIKNNYLEGVSASQDYDA